MKTLFINKNSQLRSGWKIGLSLTTSIIVIMIISFIASTVFATIYMASSGDAGYKSVEELTQAIYSYPMMNFILAIVQSTVVIIITFLFWRKLDKKPVASMGFTSLKGDYKDFVFGLILGAASIAFVFIVLMITGQVSLSGSLLKPSFSSSLITGLILFIFVGLSEEIFTRGYCMTVLNQTKNKWMIVLGSSIIFSLMHGLNPNISIVGLANIFLVGILFAYMFLKRSNLWMPIGYHITWNYFQGNVFGFHVSGMEQQGLYTTTPIKDNLLNGGQFGPEGGIIVTLVIIIGFILVHKLRGQRKNNIFQLK
jgi:uncharacterized protein